MKLTITRTVKYSPSVRRSEEPGKDAGISENCSRTDLACVSPGSEFHVFRPHSDVNVNYTMCDGASVSLAASGLVALCTPVVIPK